MSTGVPPTSNDEFVGVLEDGREYTLPVRELLRRFGVDALIRMHLDDFDQLAAAAPALVHFNLERTSNEAGLCYAIVPILRPGHRRDNGHEVLPIVDPSRYRRGTCTEVLQRVPLAQVTAEQFSHSLPSIRTREQLRAALVHRYAAMFPDLDEEALVGKGCTVTRIILDTP